MVLPTGWREWCFYASCQHCRGPIIHVEYYGESNGYPPKLICNCGNEMIEARFTVTPTNAIHPHYGEDRSQWEPKTTSTPESG